MVEKESINNCVSFVILVLRSSPFNGRVPMGSAGLSAGRYELTGWLRPGALRGALRALFKASSDSPLLSHTACHHPHSLEIQHLQGNVKFHQDSLIIFLWSRLLRDPVGTTFYPSLLLNAQKKSSGKILMKEFLVVIQGPGNLNPWDGLRIECQGKTEDQYP